MKTDELREKYLAFFESKGHTRRPSDVLVPTWDPSVLFTPAGMNQFKDHFLGKVKLDFTRATTCQKCLRTGDIENVGRTAYHHTFFEMLGNFSFGDYFKREAIQWAWEFLASKKWLGIEPARLSATVYQDDEEAYGIWREVIGLSPERIERMGEDENFWPAGAPSSGPDGVCGPCSEIYYHGDDGNEVEIWNLVFTQFHRVGDPPDNLRPLPSKNIDTGMGLERTAAALQGVASNYHIDSLRPIVEAAADVCGIAYEPPSENGRRLRRITDHVRACTFAIHENVYPGPNQAKYVVRRLLRRAVLDGHQIGVRQPFLHKIVPAVADAMRVPCPELGETAERVSGVIQKEESNFLATIDDGLERIDRVFDEMKESGRVMVDGAAAAELYQTFGVPPELFQTMAAERNLTFDWDGFDRAMQQHGIDSGAGQRELFKTGPMETLKRALHYTEFLGYETTEAEATVKGIVAGRAPDDRLCDRISEVGHGEAIRLVLDRTPFYGESGGQVGDTGTIISEAFEFEVVDTQKDGDLVVHFGHLKRGEITEGARVKAAVDAERRQAIRRAHSATHVMHHALQKVLGRHAQQQGSKVDRDWLRFDFTNLSPVSAEQLAAIEEDVHRNIAAAAPVGWKQVPLAEAREAGAMMLFGEKYPDPVRMVSMGEFSRELCGGTHLDNTSEVGEFEIISEEGVSAGTRRVVALTGARAEENMQATRSALRKTAEHLDVAMLRVPEAVESLSRRVRSLKKHLASGESSPADEAAPAAADGETDDYPMIKDLLHRAARALNVAPHDVPDRVAALAAEVGELEEKLEQRQQAGSLSADELIARGEKIGDVTVIVAEVPGLAAGGMRQLIDQIRQKTKNVAVLLASSEGRDKVTLVAGISRDLQERGVNAGNWVRGVAQIVGGSGGGRADMAQAGGKQPEKLPEAFVHARKNLENILND